jgi:hypothetical protein
MGLNFVMLVRVIIKFETVFYFHSCKFVKKKIFRIFDTW